jgi:hypothetical protein
VTATFLVIVPRHVRAVPEHPPDHPANTEFVSGVAVKVTAVPEGYVDPDGFAVTVPDPVPFFVTVKV